MKKLQSIISKNRIVVILKDTPINLENITNQLILNGGSIIESRKKKVIFRGLFFKLKWFFLLDYPIHWNPLRDVYYGIIYKYKSDKLCIIMNFSHIFVLNLVYFIILISIYFLSSVPNDYFFRFFIITFLFFILKISWDVWYMKKGIINILTEPRKN